MFGGKIAKKGVRIEGTYKMHAYQNVWQEARPITYAGELTPAVCAGIKAAWNAYNGKLPTATGFGALRWSSPDVFSHVDVERRAVIVNCTENLCD